MNYSFSTFALRQEETSLTRDLEYSQEERNTLKELQQTVMHYANEAYRAICCIECHVLRKLTGVGEASPIFDYAATDNRLSGWISDHSDALEECSNALKALEDFIEDKIFSFKKKELEELDALRDEEDCDA